MDTRHQLQGIELRYALTLYLLQHGPATVDELIKAMKWQGFDIGGRASKQVSDALRWERRRGRVRRLARGLYGPGYVPRATEYRIHQRVLALRAAAKPLWLGGTLLYVCLSLATRTIPGTSLALPRRKHIHDSARVASDNT